LTADEGAAVYHSTPEMRLILQIWQIFSAELSFGIHPSLIRPSCMLNFASITDIFSGKGVESTPCLSIGIKEKSQSPLIESSLEML